MYGLLDMWHGSFPSLLWKQFDLLMALYIHQFHKIIYNHQREKKTKKIKIKSRIS